MEREETGRLIRIQRKKTGLTMEQLAQKVGISPITLHRIETEKSSPSVSLLSEIANVLNKPIVTFFGTTRRPVIQITRENQRVISNRMLKFTLIGPRKMIADDIVVAYGEHKKGNTVDPHTNSGTEFVYMVEGKGELKHGDKSYVLEAGDSMAFNAGIEHSVTALEMVKFFGILVENSSGAGNTASFPESNLDTSENLYNKGGEDILFP